jgi:hypothetical protein
MAIEREIWFRRVWFVMVLPIHWKGFALVAAEGVVFLSLGYLAGYLPAPFDYAGILPLVVVGLAFASYVGFWLLAFQHSRP